MTSPTPDPPFSFHALIVLVLSAIQTLSGVCITLIESYKTTIQTIKRVNKSHADYSFPVEPTEPVSSSSSHKSATPPPPELPVELEPDDLAQPGLTMLAEMITAEERFSSRLVMSNASMAVASFPTFVNRYVFSTPFPHRTHPRHVQLFLVLFASHIIFSKPWRDNHKNAEADDVPQWISRPHSLTAYTRRTSSHASTHYPIYPSRVTRLVIALCETIYLTDHFLTAHIMPILLGPDSHSTIADALDPVSDEICNIHLIVLLLDRILLALFPELAATLS